MNWRRAASQPSNQAGRAGGAHEFAQYRNIGAKRTDADSVNRQTQLFRDLKVDARIVQF